MEQQNLSSSPTSSGNVAVAEPTASSNGTTETTETKSSEAPQTAPAEETFTTVDLKTLDKKNLEAYNNMLRDYKKKTAAIAEASKRYERYKDVDIDAALQKAQYFEQLSQDENIRNYLNSASEAAQESISPEEWTQMQSDPQKMAEFVQSQVAQAQAKMAQQQQLAVDAAKFVDSFAGEMDNQTGQKKRADFGELLELGLINHFRIGQMASGGPETWGPALETAYTEAKNLYKKVYDKVQADLKKAAKETISNSSEMPSASGPNIAAKMRNPNDVAEAYELAKRGKRIY